MCHGAFNIQVTAFLSTMRVSCHSHKKERLVSYEAVNDWSAEHRRGLSSQREQLISNILFRRSLVFQGLIFETEPSGTWKTDG